MEETIKQHFSWKILRTDIRRNVEKCHICQLCKKDSKKYSLLVKKETKS